MKSRREFLLTSAAAVVAAARPHGDRGQSPGAGRRRITIDGRRIRVVDVHAHCEVPVDALVRGTPFEEEARVSADLADIGSGRLGAMDARGIDVQVLSINGYWWYAADQDLAERVVAAQNAGLAEIVRRHPERFVALASVALQYPEQAARQLEDAMQMPGIRGVTIGGHVRGEDLSLPKYDPFWARAAALGAPVLMHPGGADNIVREEAFAGRGSLGNIIGNPLETTYFLSRLIFDGTLDRHPDLRIIAPHGGGYLPSYLGRSDAACRVRDNANCANREDPREYFRRQILVDSMVFTPEGLRHLVAEIGAGQVVFGTDMPYTWPDTLDVVSSAGFLGAREKASILGDRLIELLRLA